MGIFLLRPTRAGGSCCGAGGGLAPNTSEPCTALGAAQDSPPGSQGWRHRQPGALPQTLAGRCTPFLGCGTMARSGEAPRPLLPHRAPPAPCPHHPTAPPPAPPAQFLSP